MRTIKAIQAVCLFALSLLASSGATITGHVHVIAGPSDSKSTVIVYAEALDGRTPPKPGHYQMVQRNKTFIPHVLAVPVGSTVSFPNADPIFHNVFSMSAPAPFDLGLYRAGASKSLLFTEPATYWVFCNIHPQMLAVLLVLPTSWIVEGDSQGSYQMDLPPGRYRLTAWSERSSPVSSTIDVESTSLAAPELTLDESKFVATTHKNKYGQDYPSKSYEPLRH
jgi:plastocyanin